MTVCALACALVAAEVTAIGSAAPNVAEKFTFASVIALAEAYSKKPYEEPAPLPPALAQLDYDDWRDIRFNADAALGRAGRWPFEIQFFHPGFLYQQTVAVQVIENGKSAPVSVARDLFDYGKNRFLAPTLPEQLGAAGFRIHGPINTKKYLDEFLVFLGASYFRAVAAGQRYGMSARGLAVDTASPHGEEFPWFRAFWVQKPAPGAKDVVVYALMDSQSLTGAYSFTVRPGKETVMDVSARIFMRKPVEKLGFAPLTSMFFYGENSLPTSPRDWRPEVHDSDGLLVRLGTGEWLWRPLQNPSTLTVSRFEADDVMGFGLLQRDQRFGNYEDLESHYELRPSVWVEPLNNWGRGAVELYLIPTDREINDNVVAYFTPDRTPVPGEPVTLEYRMRWHTAPGANMPPGARVVATRTTLLNETTRLFIVEFAGTDLAKLPKDANVVPVVSCGPGARILEVQAYPNTETGGWRLAFQVEFKNRNTLERMLGQIDPSIELRAFLKRNADVLSETWSYAFKPERGE